MPNPDWQQEIASSIKTSKQLNDFFELFDFKDKPIQENFKYPILIPKKFANKIKNAGPNSPLWNQFIPSNLENNNIGLKDPIGDGKFNQERRVIHRYENRALLWVTNLCPIICRYCFRKNELYESSTLNRGKINEACEYLKQNPKINEVIFTGGDPLILSDNQLEEWLNEIEKIKHIEFIRFHSRVPIILPSRINESFINLLNKFKTRFVISFVIHINHVDEIDDEVREILKRIFTANFKLFSQTVLLKGVNDSIEALRELFLELAKNYVTPYYLHHPDKALGTDHFQISIETGRRIYSQLQNLLSGWMIPKYVLDIPGGRGKVPIYNSEKIQFDGHLIDKSGNKVRINT